MMPSADIRKINSASSIDEKEDRALIARINNNSEISPWEDKNNYSNNFPVDKAVKNKSSQGLKKGPNN